MSSKRTLWFTGLAALGMFGFAVGCTDPGKKASATLASKSSSTTVGTAAFTQEGTKVTVKIDVNGAPAGKHGVHIHDKGDCSSADGLSAGGHWNPTGVPHAAPGTGHLGDIGNFDVAADGKGSITYSSDKWTLTADPADAGSTNVVGHAVIIHGGVDDLNSQPTGDAGSRIACGVIALTP